MSSSGQDHGLEALLDYLKRGRGFDFSGYKRSTLTRRVQRRMHVVEVSSYGEYLDYLQVHPNEFTELFNTILINVTGFFRDPEAWDYLASTIVPRIIRNRSPSEPIRVWCAGVASGEEAYTVAMLMAEALGPEQYRERVKIYATDVDEEALNQARQAAYGARAMNRIPAELAAKYFESTNGTPFSFHKDLRRAVIFGRHDLVQDAPISRLDLLVCRNTLMYFNAETQARILAHFHFALNNDGYLFLGKAEMLITHADLFTPVDLKWRVFTKGPRTNLRERLLVMAQSDETNAPVVNHVRLRDMAFDTNSVPQIAIDRAGQLMLANEQARALFGLNPRDLGKPFHDLQMSYRPIELRSHIERAYTEQRPILLEHQSWTSSKGTDHYFDVWIVPLFSNRGEIIGTSVSFADVSRSVELQAELFNTRQELETALEELQSTVEELETTNEELQSTNEELETTNEELQSTNEELETMNEELQSTNEELETMNEELRQRTTEVNQVNSFLESIVTGIQDGVVVLDRDFQVHVWNRRSEDLWGLRSDEVEGKHFLNLDIGLPVDQLRQPIRACLTGEAARIDITLAALNRRGRRIRCRVTGTPLVGSNEEIRGVILLMEDHDGE